MPRCQKCGDDAGKFYLCETCEKKYILREADEDDYDTNLKDNKC